MYETMSNAELIGIVVCGLLFWIVGHAWVYNLAEKFLGIRYRKVRRDWRGRHIHG